MTFRLWRQAPPRLLLAFALAAWPLVAATDDGLGDLAGDLDLDALLLDDEFALLAEEDFVVSAVRHVQRIEHSPSAVTVITREEILASGYDNLPDLMRLVPGVDVLRVSQAHAGVGVRTGTSQGGDIVRVLLDGRDMATHLLGTPLWMGMPVDPESVERIEVIRGPGSTLYGSQALQGVINIVTRKAGEAPFNVEGRASGAALHTHQVDLRAHGTSGAFGYWFSLGHDLRAPQDDVLGDAMRALRARGRVDYRPTDDLEASLEVGHVDIEGTAITAVGAGTHRARWPYLLSRLRLGATEVQLVAEETRGHLDVDFALIIPEDEDRPAMRLGEVPPVQHDTRSAELWAQHALEPLPGHRLTAGASARVIHHLPGTMVDCGDVDRASFDPDACRPIELFEWRLGAYLQDEWQIHEAVTLTGGMRFDWSSLNPDPGLSPRLAAVWSPHPQHAVRASYGRAYRYPNFFESHGHVLMTPDPDAPPDLTRAVQYLFAVGGGNPAMDNQTVDSVEAGWRGRFFDGRLVSTADLFALSIRNRFHLGGLEEIALVPGFGGVPTLPEGVLPLYENRQEPLVAAGGEATITWRPSRRLRLFGHYALNYVLRDEDIWQAGDAGLREPRHRVVASGRYEVIEGLAAGLDVHWRSGYLSRSLDPASMLLDPVLLTLGREPLVMGSLRYRRPVGEQTFEVGLTGFNVLGRPMQEQTAAEDLARRLRIYVAVRP